MSLLSLSTYSVGPPDNAFNWYLHSSGQTLSSGFQVAMGDGTGTALWIGSTVIGVIGAGGKSTIGTSSTGTRAVLLADGAGTLWPAMVSVAAQTANSTTTPATVADFAVTLEASAIYEFEMLLLFKSAAATTSPQFTINGPSSQTEFVWFEVTGPPSVATLLTTTGTRAVQQFTGWGSAYSNTTVLPAGDTVYGFSVRGVCKTTAVTPAANVTLQIASEVGSSAVTLMAGSTMKFRKIN